MYESEKYFFPYQCRDPIEFLPDDLSTTAVDILKGDEVAVKVFLHISLVDVDKNAKLCSGKTRQNIFSKRHTSLSLISKSSQRKFAQIKPSAFHFH